MTPESQRIAIAEACGHSKPQHYEGFGWCSRDKYGRACIGVPDYLSSLDAMHEAEKVLTQDQQDEYRDNLKDVCFDQWERGKIPQVHTIFAPAAQRAEAFLRTLGLWKPGPSAKREL